MQQGKACNCRNSKCMKLYCQCFAARVTCGKNCRCIDCHNTSKVIENPNYAQVLADRDKRAPREQLIRTHRGCACRKSSCMKKYCECFQAGILCKDTCKCLDCQNNQSLTNKKVIMKLKRKESDTPNNQNNINLYPLYLSQNTDHLSAIVAEVNPLKVSSAWFEDCASSLYEGAKNGSIETIMLKFIQILNQVERGLIEEDNSEDANIKKQVIDNKDQFRQQRQGLDQEQKEIKFNSKMFEGNSFADLMEDDRIKIPKSEQENGNNEMEEQMSSPQQRFT